MKFKTCRIEKKEELIFGSAPYPVKTPRGLVIGGGRVYPELNFTLPPMSINSNTFEDIKKQYREIVTGALDRAVHLDAKGVILEFEPLIEMTQTPDFGVELVKEMNEFCEQYFKQKGLKSEIRLTPNDLREFERPPRQRTSPLLDKMMELFERGADAGGDMLSIESTGGKEIFDDALLACNIREILFSLAVLGVRDMKMLWKKIVGIANQKGKIAAGDTACGFGNTAMILAEKQFIPKCVAAVVRIISVVRTIVAIEEGAVGPGKDCGYENVFLKAITGTPISMEGKTSACAHPSPVGNIAAACADLWSNESVQNIKLLAGMAPTVYLEQLEYDTRLMNQALIEGKDCALQFQKLLVNSDQYLDPQALILAPENVLKISMDMVKGNGYIDSAIRGSLTGLDIIERAVSEGKLKLPPMEHAWIETMKNDLSDIPTDETRFIESMLPFMPRERIRLDEYGINP
jgi:methanol--5-hydroxybenzimidazolylcobamide Co-methyltransferase